MVSHSEYAAVQAIRFRGHVALRHVGGMFGKERFRRPLGEPRSRPPRRHAHGSGRYVLTLYRSNTTNPHLFLANQNRVNHPTRRSTSDTEAIALPERPARGKRNFQAPSTRNVSGSMCGVCGPDSGTGSAVSAAWWCGRTRVFDGRVGNGVPAVRVAVSGYYEKLELPRRRVYAVPPSGYPRRLISGSSTRTGTRARSRRRVGRGRPGAERHRPRTLSPPVTRLSPAECRDRNPTTPQPRTHDAPRQRLGSGPEMAATDRTRRHRGRARRRPPGPCASVVR